MPQSYFLKIDGIPGESQNEQHKDEIEVSTWSWGANVPPSQSTTGRPNVRISVSAFTFSHHVDRASPLLMKLCMKGAHAPHVVLSAIHENPDSGMEYFRLTFDNVHIISMSLNGSEANEQIFEMVTMAFTKVMEEYVTIMPDGSMGETISVTYDGVTNQVT